MRVTLLHLSLTLVLTTVANAHRGNGQSILDRPVSVRLANVPLRDALDALEKKAHTRFVYSSQSVSDAGRVSVQAHAEVLAAVLDRLLGPLGIRYEVYNDRILLSKPFPESEPRRAEEATPPAPAVFPIRGRVRDGDGGAGLAGVSVLVKGTQTGTTTDATGNYALDAPDGDATLVFSFVGYASQTVAVGGRSTLDVTLVATSSALDEVVVVGYGTARRSDLTGSVSQANLKHTDELPVPSVDQILTGRVGGLQVTQASGTPGSGSSIRIRGGNSLTGSNEPLYVIDGFPLLNDNAALDTRDAIGQPNQSSGTNQGNANGALNWLNPADIESIEVLKDASATAIYGSRGANGVIMVTTKRAKAGKFRINFSTNHGVSTQIRNGVQLLTGPEFAQLLTLAERQAGKKDSELTFNGTARPLAQNVTQNTDWLDAVTQAGLTQNYAVNFSGGKDVLFSGGASYFSQEGTLITSRLQRGTFRLNLQTDLTNWLTLTNNANYSLAVLNGPPTDTRDAVKTGPWEAALIAAPSEPVYRPNGTYFFENVPNAPVRFNPLALAYDVLNRTTTNTYLNNLSLRAKVVEGLTFESRLGFFYNNNVRDVYYNSQTTGIGLTTGGLGAKNNRAITSYLWENFATYNRTLGKNALNVVLGQGYQLTLTNDLNTTALDFANDNLGNEGLSQGKVRYVESLKLQDKLSSYFVRINDVIADRFIATFTARLDGSSKFGPANRWALFPSGALSWRVKEEPFLQPVDAVSDLKLRVSYGLSGNQAIGSLQSKALLKTENSVVGQELVPSVGIARLANEALRWETTAQFNAGVDFGFLNQQLTGSFNYYVKNTDDLLVQRIIPSSSGLNTALDNLGSISNKGVELELHADLARSPSGFRWSVDANLAHNVTRLTKLGLDNADRIYVEFVPGSISSNVGSRGIALIEGQPVGLIMGYVHDGIYQNGTEGPKYKGTAAVAGQIRFKDINGNGDVTEDDQTVIANTNPDLIYGLTNNLAFKNFDLTVQFQGVVGGDIVNAGRVYGELPSFQGNRFRESLDYWSPSNPDATHPAPGITTAADQLSSYHVSDGSFLRLKALTLGYNVPVKTKFFQSLRVYASGVNLVTLTGYKGFSPEVSAYGQSTLRRNIDHNTLPQNRTVSVGLNLGF